MPLPTFSTLDGKPLNIVYWPHLEFVTDWGREGRKRRDRSEGMRVFTDRTRGTRPISGRSAAPLGTAPEVPT